MPSDPKSQMVTVPFSITEDGEQITHGLQMKKGTADALGLDSSKFTIGFVEKNVSRPQTTRRLFPGATPITVPGGTKKQAVAVGPRQTRAKTNAKMYLRGFGNNKHGTIYYSGPRRAAVKFLEDNSTIDWTLFGNTMQLFSPRGKVLILKKAPIA
jgi:hypothetical protein